jgi:hypothetical protein
VSSEFENQGRVIGIKSFKNSLKIEKNHLLRFRKGKGRIEKKIHVRKENFKSSQPKTMAIKQE